MRGIQNQGQGCHTGLGTEWASRGILLGTGVEGRTEQRCGENESVTNRQACQPLQKATLALCSEAPFLLNGPI